MAEIVIKNGGTPKQKKRLPGIVRFLIGFIITILIIVALLVAALYICFFDNSHKATNVKADYPNEEVFNEVLVDSLDNTISTKQMQIAINQDQLTQVLYNAFNNEPQVTQFVKNIYVEADNAKYDFVGENYSFSDRLRSHTNYLLRHIAYSMIEKGLLDEGRLCLEKGCTKDMNSMQGLGYKQIIRYLDGLCSLEQAVDDVKKETRHFAKRQLTWFRREKEVIWINKDKYKDTEEILSYMEGML